MLLLTALEGRLMEFLIAYAHGQHFVGVGLDLELFDTASHSEHFSHTGNRLQSLWIQSNLRVFGESVAWFDPEGSTKPTSMIFPINKPLVSCKEDAFR